MNEIIQKNLQAIEDQIPEENILEEMEQEFLVYWLDELQKASEELKFTCIPNSTYTKSWKQKAKNKKQGLRKGLPDILLVIPAELSSENRSLMLWAEMKRKKGGVASAEQKEWVSALTKVWDVEARFCKGAKEAIEFFREYLKIN